MTFSLRFDATLYNAGHFIADVGLGFLVPAVGDSIEMRIFTDTIDYAVNADAMLMRPIFQLHSTR